MSTVTKKDLARQMAAQTGCSRTLAHAAVDLLFQHMRTQLIQGHRIEVRGFGVLSVKEVGPKPAARNPRTGERVSVPARRRVHFRPGLQLKQALSQRPSTSTT